MSTALHFPLAHVNQLFLFNDKVIVRYLNLMIPGLKHWLKQIPSQKRHKLSVGRLIQDIDILSTLPHLSDSEVDANKARLWLARERITTWLKRAVEVGYTLPDINQSTMRLVNRNAVLERAALQCYDYRQALRDETRKYTDVYEIHRRKQDRAHELQEIGRLVNAVMRRYQQPLRFERQLAFYFQQLDQMEVTHG